MVFFIFQCHTALKNHIKKFLKKHEMRTLVSACLLIAFIAFGCKKDNQSGGGSSTDQDFTSQASMDNFTEISLGQVAKAKAADTAIVRYADQVIAERVQASAQLKDIASRLKISAPDTMNAQQAVLKTQLSALSGREFDSVYIHSEITSHDNAVVLYQHEMNFGSNGELKDFATQNFSRLQTTLNLADSLVVNY